MTTLPLSSHGKPIDTFGRAAELDSELRRAVRGEVRFDRGSRALYATDASNYRQVPIGVVVPRDEDDVRAAVAVCRSFEAPILARGAGTSLAGQSCNVAVVLDFTKYMNRILELDIEKRIARVQPGVILDTLRARAERHQLTFGPDPSTHSRCSLGGMIGNNSCGTHSLLAGKTVDNVHDLTILLYDGTELTVGATSEEELDAIVREGGRRGAIYAALRSIRDQHAERIRTGFPQIPRRVSGYNLDQLLPENGFHVARALVGSEGTCAIVLGATLRLIESPQHRALVGLGYPDSFAAADHVPAILESSPIGLEGFEGGIIDGLQHKNAPNLELLPAGRGILLVEYGSNDPAEARTSAQRLVERLSRLPGAPLTRIYNAAEAKAVWKIRESGPRMASAVPGSLPRWEGWDDASVAPDKLGPYLAGSAQAARRIQLPGGVLRTLRPRLHSHAGELRLRDRARDSTVRGVHQPRRRSRHPLRRIAVGRARRRAVARRAAAEDVRSRAHDGVRRIQGRVGPGEPDEPAQADRRLSTDGKSASRRRLSSSATRDVLLVCRRQGIVQQGDDEVHRPWRVPQARLRNHVPELHGDARRAPQHARPSAPLVGAAAERGSRGLVEERRGERGARPLPVVQGLQVGMPNQRRPRDLPRGIPRALLPGAPPSDRGIRVRAHRQMGRARIR